MEKSLQKPNIRRALHISPALAGVLLAAAVLLFALLTVTPTYYENDDSNIALALSGARSGAPYPTHPFINCILGLFVSGLYGLAPSVPWWAVLQMLTVTTSMAVACFCLLRNAKKRGLPLLLALAACGALVFSQYFYPLSILTFTLTSAAAGSAGVALLLAMEEDDGPKARFCMAAGSLVCLFICFLFRNATGYAMLCFFGGALCYRVLRRLLMPKGPARRKLLIRAAVYAACLLALSVATVLVHKWGLREMNMPEFLAFDAARGNFMDYPRDSFAENPALYASVGWDETLYRAVDRWFFMDARVSAESLSAITDGSAAQWASLSKAFGILRSFFGKYPMAVYMLLPPCCMLLAVLVLWTLDRKRFAEPVAALGFFAGGFALALFLCLRERLILRSFQLLCMPLTAALFCLAAQLWPRRLGALRSVLCALLTLCALFFAYRTQSEVRHYDTEAYLSNSDALMEYVLAHPDELFIADTHVANNIDALAVYPDAKPTNLMDWGGTGMYTGFWEKQLALYGIDRFTAEVLFRPDTYYVTNPQNEDLAVLTAYLNSVYGSVTLTQSERINDEIALYRVARGEEGQQ